MADPNPSTRRVWRYLRTPVYVLLALVGIDLVILATREAWERHSPDDYDARLEGCRKQPRDFVFVGGSAVSEGLDPERITGVCWRGRPLTDGYALGLPGGTTSEFYHAVKHGCPTPPLLLVYGITASDLNDSRHEPHGPASLMTCGDVADWAIVRPDSREWVVRTFLREKATQTWSLYRYRHGIRMWAALQADAIFPRSSPEQVREATELRAYADALRDGNGYAPAAGFVNRRYDVVKEVNAPLPPFTFLDRYKTGSHLTYLHRLLRWAGDRGTTLVLLDMPVTADLEAKHPAAFAEYRRLLAELEQSGVVVLRAHRETVGITDAGFADTIHLNGVGARKLSLWVRDRLEELGRTDHGAQAVARGADRGRSAVIFASKAFLVFLLVVLIGYHLLRRRPPKYACLLAASWIFYAWCSPQYLWVLLLLTVIDYAVGLKLEREADDRLRRRWVAVSVVSNLALLAAFKYAAFAYDNGRLAAGWFGYDTPLRAWDLLLPLGISFHTFQGISYTVDVYRRHIPAVRSFLDYSLFVAFFPQMAAGPIVRAAEFLPQMATPPAVTPAQVTDGMRLFVGGLFKKLFIADQLDHLIVGPVFADPSAFGPDAHRWAVLAWAVQIYCDFSGYSDMAIGCAKWFGFEFPANFNYPYLATSITDFWRRWHLSLSTWLRDYLYFPLGGSRYGEARTFLNLFIVFVLCGLWHGATWAWLGYGVLFGVLICFHRAFDRAVAGVQWADCVRRSRPWQLLAWATTMTQLLVGLILIRAPDWEAGTALLRSLFGLGTGASDGVPVWVPALVALGLAGHALELVRSRVRLPIALPEGVRAIGYASAVALLVALTPGVGKTFIYIQF